MLDYQGYSNPNQLMATTIAQDYLFQRIREMLDPGIQMVDEMSDLLHVSSDSAYRRIRGETPLILEEAILLCNHYKISLDKLFAIESGFTLFHTERVHHTNFTFEKYLGNILLQMEQVNAFSEKEIIYLSKDLPFFHNFLLEPLFAFHYFFWMKSILRHPDFETQKFDLNCLTPAIKKIGKAILSTYNSIPSSEIWNTECINSLIFQIEYYKEAGYFKKTEDIMVVYNAIDETILHIKNQAEAGAKYLPGQIPDSTINRFGFYYNRVTLGDNTILASVDSVKIVFLNYDVMNYMVTKDQKFCQDTYNDLRAIIQRSTLISVSGEKQRNIFFNRIFSKTEERKNSL